MKKLADNIKIYRNMRGLTQTDLAFLLHKSVGAVSNWEKNVNAPDVDTIEDICQILEITPNDIFGWNENQETQAYMQDLSEAIEYIENVKKERAEQNKKIREYAEKFGKLLNFKDMNT